MYRILMVEDNAEEAATLRGHLERYASEHDTSFVVTWKKSALEVTGPSLGVDLIFMDIDLPGMNGLEVAEELRENGDEVPIVFVTNLAQYAIEGYRVNALDFIVKPVVYYDFALRMDKALRILSRRRASTIAITTKVGVRVVELADLEYVEVLRHDVIYHMAGNADPLRQRGSLTKVEQRLSGSTFVRVSGAFLVNMDHIDTIKGDDITLASGATVHMTRTWRKSAMETIARYLGGNL